jgi:hypothetical protein
MFLVDPAASFLRATREQVVGVLESINQPVVVVPGKQAQIAQAFVVALRNPGGSCSVHIYLFLTQTREAVMYAHEPRQLTAEQCRGAEDEAVHFCESMGFLLDNLNFASLPGGQRDELLRRLPPFQRDVSRIDSQSGNLMAAQTGNLTPPGGVVDTAARPPSTLSPQNAALLGGVPTAPGPASATPEQIEKLARLLAAF